LCLQNRGGGPDCAAGQAGCTVVAAGATEEEDEGSTGMLWVEVVGCRYTNTLPLHEHVCRVHQPAVPKPLGVWGVDKVAGAVGGWLPGRAP